MQVISNPRAGLLYETAKNSSWPVTALGNKGPLKVLNGTKLILDDYENNLDSFRISLESFRSFIGPLLHKPVIGQELFFAVSYNKPALITICMHISRIIFEQHNTYLFLQ